ncbi:hypothetical protein [Herbaspirillum autotrophicum]|uniref:hypothetical protein n=1 Tax=Herbaspirillum autotrophicum TaxID=180195 RepID=UPI00067A9534|nr:hypothetical protein [Herbaspirillum autotrophicum]
MKNKTRPVTAQFTRAYMLSALLFAAAAVLSVASHAGGVAEALSPGRYAEQGATKAVVIMSANWSRKWGCGAYENAQLQYLAFDNLGLPKTAANAAPDLLVKDDTFLPAKNRFANYVYLIEPGEYSLTGFSIKLGKSVSNVGYFVGNKDNLVQDGKSKAGKFTVAAGDIVYVGHFWLDCATAPMPWRYYPETREDFDIYLDSIKQQYPEIDPAKVQFRLYETSVMGLPFSLP